MSCGNTISVIDVPLLEAEPLAEWLYDLACIPSNRLEGDERYLGKKQGASNE
jgi:hypothetical protein